MKAHFAATLICALLLAAPATAGPMLDGGHILNSGSTNTAGWAIALRSDGSANVAVRMRAPYATGTAPRSFSVAKDITAKFFADVRAARGSDAPVRGCMKSASFGSTTIVEWHGWRSPDLECPQASAQLRALADDVRAIRATAPMPTLTPRMYHIPYSPRRTEPTPTPRHRP